MLKKMIITLTILISLQNNLFASQPDALGENILLQDRTGELSLQLDSSIASLKECVSFTNQCSNKLDQLLETTTKLSEKTQDLKRSTAELQDITVMNLFVTAFTSGIVTASAAFVILSYIDK